MAFSALKFMGCTVRAFSGGLGLNGSPGQLSIQVVEDTASGDVLSLPDIGTPAYFEFGDYQYFGIFQNYEKNNSRDGEIYTLTLVDPVTILDSAEVILDGYNGAINVRNLFNVYGYYENQSFGLSLVNSSGMPWTRVRDGLLAIANQPLFTSYGGPLTYRGISYSLDLSHLPQPSVNYRIGGLKIGLLELIQQICEDGGCDFYVTLDGYTIRPKIISRTAQPPLGTIAALTESYQGGTLVSSRSGLEARHEQTAMFLVGGQVQTLNLGDTLTQFWGFDINGEPITDTIGNFNLKGRDGDVLKTVTTRFMNLNASPVADIIGSVLYSCSVLEMRFAQASQTAWRAFMRHQKPAVASIIGLTSPIHNLGAAGGLQKQNMVNDAAAEARALAIAALSGDLFQQEQRMYEFVRGYADEYLGRKFLVGVPFILSRTDSETLLVETSYDVSDGGYLPEGSSPLGLSLLNEDRFKTQDGRFRAFARYDNISTLADLSTIPVNNSVIEGASLFVELQVNPRIIFAPNPTVEVQVPGVIREIPGEGIFGDIDLVAATLQMTPADAQKILKNPQMGNLGVEIAPDVIDPVVAAIPLRSNVLTYGPWYAQGAYGKVKFEQDTSLTPWDWGGFTTMNLAGNARVAQSVTNAQVVESGSIEVVGQPTISLGGVLSTGGPNLTNIDVRYSPQGVTTTYRFQTFTPRFGVVPRGTTERIKRIGIAAQETRRNLRKVINERIDKLGVIQQAARTQFAWLVGAPKAIKRETPHDVLIAKTDYDASTDHLRIGVSSATAEEAVAFAGANEDAEHKRTSTMSLAGLIRPFSYDNSLQYLPTVESPAVTGLSPNGTSLNPWRGQNDVEFYTWGDTYEGLHAYRRGSDLTKARPMALRGPLMIAGWGETIDGGVVPTGVGGGYANNYLHRSDLWKVGPADLLWDERRKVWSARDFMVGITDQEIGPSGTASGVVSIYQGATDIGSVYAKNWLGNAIPAGSRVHLALDANTKTWFALQDIAGSGSSSSGGGSVSCLLSESTLNSSLFTVGSGVTGNANLRFLEVFDDGSFFDFSTSSSGIFFPEAGQYQVSIGTTLSSSFFTPVQACDVKLLLYSKSLGTYIPNVFSHRYLATDLDFTNLNLGVVIPTSVYGDEIYVSVQATANSSASWTLNATNSWFSAHKVG